jgi:hypothetical protein
MNDIQRARLLLEQRNELLAEIRTQSEALRRLARYRNDTDSVPDAASLASGDADAGSSVLVEDCWEIYRLLLR